MVYKWEDEKWYLAHKSRWDALEFQGWEFSNPLPIHNRVGLTMKREGDTFTMYVARWTPQEVHSELLERCEYHAKEASGVLSKD